MISLAWGVDMYFAIIGDIKDSKKIEDRAGFQKKLGELLAKINTDYACTIAANFIITIGDEFQGLLASPQYILNIIERIKFGLYPVRVRFGIGGGGIETEIIREMAIGADGPAYHHARKMISEIKTGERGKMSTSTDIKISGCFEPSVHELINSNLSLCSFIESKWTKKQRMLIEDSTLSNKSQREIAAKFGISQSSVQRRLKSAGYYDYIHARKIIKSILMEKWGVT